MKFLIGVILELTLYNTFFFWCKTSIDTYTTRSSSAKGDIMTQVIEAIEQALQEQDIDKVYEHYHHFLTILTQKKTFKKWQI